MKLLPVLVNSSALTDSIRNPWRVGGPEHHLSSFHCLANSEPSMWRRTNDLHTGVTSRSPQGQRLRTVSFSLAHCAAIWIKGHFKKLLDRMFSVESTSRTRLDAQMKRPVVVQRCTSSDVGISRTGGHGVGVQNKNKTYLRITFKIQNNLIYNCLKQCRM